MSSNAYQTELTSSPLVSVLMNCFNGEKYLRDAIDSVIAQSYSNWEIIFWDNQSTDSSASIVKSYNDSRIKYYYASAHTLLYEARNYAYAQSSGELIAFLDVDDSWHPEKLKSQVPLFFDPKVALSCSNYWIDDQVRDKRSLAIKKSMQKRKKSLDSLLRYYDVGLLTLIIRRSALSPLSPPFDKHFHIIGDFDLVIRLAAVWDFAYVSEPLAFYRIHGDNESIKRQELMVFELESRFGEPSINNVLADACSQSSMAAYLNYSKASQAILLRNRAKALIYTLKLPLGYLKFKLLVGLILPSSVVQRIF